MPVLAFLLSEDIPNVFDELKPEMPQGTEDILKWFEDNYIRGRVRRNLRNGNTVRLEPVFPLKLWLIAELIDQGIP